MGRRRLITLMALGMVVALAAFVWFFPSHEDYRGDNPYWNGTSELSRSYGVVPLKSLSALSFIVPKYSKALMS